MRGDGVQKTHRPHNTGELTDGPLIDESAAHEKSPVNGPNRVVHRAPTRVPMSPRSRGHRRGISSTGTSRQAARIPERHRWLQETAHHTPGRPETVPGKAYAGFHHFL